jgi:hypothetical protein
MKRLILTVLVALTLAGVGTVYAYQAPKVNVGKKHPNIEAAQKLCLDAWARITAAQKANEFDLGGHAQKAKELLDQANKELKLAAEVANK